MVSLGEIRALPPTYARRFRLRRSGFGGQVGGHALGVGVRGAMVSKLET